MKSALQIKWIIIIKVRSEHLWHTGGVARDSKQSDSKILLSTSALVTSPDRRQEFLFSHVISLELYNWTKDSTSLPSTGEY